MRLATVDRGKDEKASGREEGSCPALAAVFFLPRRRSDDGTIRVRHWNNVDE